MQAMLDHGDDRDWSADYQGALILSELWALEANAPFSEWTYLRPDPDENDTEASSQHIEQSLAAE
jgi:hypothetical protein